MLYTRAAGANRYITAYVIYAARPDPVFARVATKPSPGHMAAQVALAAHLFARL